MLKLLLDEHISPSVAVGLRRRDPNVRASSLLEWEGGSFLGHEDEACLAEAARLRWTFVTYDRRTIPPLLKQWTEEGRQHAGVIFVDDKTIPPSEIGTLVRALAALAKQGSSWDWTDRICFLHR